MRAKLYTATSPRIESQSICSVDVQHICGAAGRSFEANDTGSSAGERVTSLVACEVDSAFLVAGGSALHVYDASGSRRSDGAAVRQGASTGTTGSGITVYIYGDVVI